jgi:hypothetical protein
MAIPRMRLITSIAFGTTIAWKTYVNATDPKTLEIERPIDADIRDQLASKQTIQVVLGEDALFLRLRYRRELFLQSARTRLAQGVLG